MKRIMLFLAIIALTVCVVPALSYAQSSGVVIDFQNVAADTYFGWPQPYPLYGMNLSASWGDLVGVANYGGNHVAIDWGWGSPGWLNDQPAIVVFSTASGRPFYFNSLEYGNWTGGTPWWEMAVAGVDSQGVWIAYTEFYPTTKGNILTAAALGIENVPIARLWISMKSSYASDAQFYFDNVNVTLPNVYIGDCDSGASDRPAGLQLSIQQLISAKIAENPTHDVFMDYVSELTNTLKKSNVITNQEKSGIRACAAQSSIGR